MSAGIVVVAAVRALQTLAPLSLLVHSVATLSATSWRKGAEFIERTMAK